MVVTAIGCLDCDRMVTQVYYYYYYYTTLTLALDLTDCIRRSIVFNGIKAGTK